MLIKFFKVIILIFAFLLPVSSFAFPDQEKTGAGGTSPPFDFGFSDTVTGAVLKDDDTMIVSYSDSLKIVDLGYFELEAAQPPPLTEDDDTAGNLDAFAYSSEKDRVYASQDDGDCIVYDLANITEDPVSVEIVEDQTLGPIVIDNNSQRAYIANSSDDKVYVLNLGSLTTTNTVTLAIPSITSFTITDAVHVPLTDEIYFTTNKGSVFYMDAGGLSATEIIVDAAHTANLTAIAATPAGDYVYVTNESDHMLAKISTATHNVVKDSIDLDPNQKPTDIVITKVNNPMGGTGQAVYAYVAGTRGISIVNTAGDLVLDMGTDAGTDHEPLAVSSTPKSLVASSVDDGYVYSIGASQNVAVVTANPWVTVSSITYSSGGDRLGIGESMTVKFQADETGTAVIKANGNVSGNGTALVDDAGASSWSITAPDTDVTVTINYDDNSSAFVEGENKLFVFVTDASNERGRIAKAVNVDTPPPLVTIRSAGFGTEKIYVTFDRIDQADMSHYNVYVDTNQENVMTKTEVGAEISQTSSGSTITGSVSGLANGVVYFIAMEAVDEAGNKSASRTNTFADGSTAYGIPQQTAGPCGFSGETGGCSVNRSPLMLSTNYISFLMIVLSILLLNILKKWPSRDDPESHFLKYPIYGKKSGRRDCRTASRLAGSLILLRVSEASEQTMPRALTSLFIIIFVIVSLLPLDLSAREPSPQWWSVEVKTGFWIPQSVSVKSFFGDCCNLITRIQGGLLAKGRYGAEAGVGFFIKDGTARGTLTGESSSDKFNFFILPMETSFAWRMDYWNWDYLVPYMKAGADYVYYRESLAGNVTQGLKMGFHGGGGLQMSFKVFGKDILDGLDEDFGINDVFLTLEAMYQYINNFGGKGLDLSGGVYSVGFLFEF
jgi:hypothetical protein